MSKGKGKHKGKSSKEPRAKKPALPPHFVHETVFLPTAEDLATNLATKFLIYAQPIVQQSTSEAQVTLLYDLHLFTWNYAQADDVRQENAIANMLDSNRMTGEPREQMRRMVYDMIERKLRIWPEEQSFLLRWEIGMSDDASRTPLLRLFELDLIGAGILAPADVAMEAAADPITAAAAQSAAGTDSGPDSNAPDPE